MSVRSLSIRYVDGNVILQRPVVSVQSKGHRVGAFVLWSWLCTRILRHPTRDSIEFSLALDCFWNKTLVKIARAWNPQLVPCRRIALSLHKCNTPFLVNLGKPAARRLFYRTSDWFLIRRCVKIIRPYNTRWSILRRSLWPKRWHVIFTRTRPPSGTNAVASVIQSVTERVFILDCAALRMSIRASHDADFARANRLLFLSQIRAIGSLRLALEPRQCSRPAAPTTPFQHNVLKPLFEPV